MENNISGSNPQGGNVLFLILVAAALFAALSYVAIQSGRSGGNDATREKARLQAAELLNHATAAQTAVGRLLIGGCLDSQISFENTGDTAHINPSSPSDGHCNVFTSNGGGVSLKMPRHEWSTTDPYFTYSASSSLTGLSTTCAQPDCADLTMNLRNVSISLCDAINTMNGHVSLNLTRPIDTQRFCPFKGTYDCNGDNTPDVVYASASLRGLNSVCYQDAVNGLTYTQVILER